MKFLKFLIHIITGAPAVLTVLGKISAPTLAAILAVFYDVTKFIANDAAAFEQLMSGQISTAIGTILSPQTQQLLAKIVADFKAGEKLLVDDFHQLEIAANSASSLPTVTSTTVS